MSTIPQQTNPQQFRIWNESMLEKYDPNAFHHHGNPLVRFIERRRVKAIFGMMDLKRDDKVIEIGCGAANVIEQAHAGVLFGLDISASILLKAKHRLGKKIGLFQADAKDLPCKDQSIQKVICSEVLEHLLDPSAALDEIARVMESDGAAIISVPNEFLINRIKTIMVSLGLFKWFFQSKGSESYPEMPQRMEDEWHLHAFTLEEWLRLFRRSFRVTRTKGIPFGWIPLRYVFCLEKSA